jgi:hypothetical protein
MIAIGRNLSISLRDLYNNSSSLVETRYRSRFFNLGRSLSAFSPIPMSEFLTYGNDTGHRLGRPTSDAPQPIPLPPNIFLKLIALGWQHGHFVTIDNDFYSWGTGVSWRLATGLKDDLPKPARVDTFPRDYVFKQIECGEKFGASIDVHGRLLVWGCGYSHSPTALELPAPAVYIATGPIMLTVAMMDGSFAIFNRKQPMKHLRIENEFVVMVGCGKSNVIALGQSGRAFVCGTEDLGVQTISETPQLIAYPTEIVSVFAYNNFWLVDKNGGVAAFGNNDHSSLGMGMSDVVVLPRTYSEWPFLGQEIQQIAMGELFTLVLTSTGLCYAVGKLDFGLSANPARPGSIQTGSFVECTCFAGKKVMQIACGYAHAAVLIGGSAPPAVLRLNPGFDENAYPHEPVAMLTTDLRTIMVDDGTNELHRIGLFPGDLCRFEAVELILVIGVLADDRSTAVV